MSTTPRIRLRPDEYQMILRYRETGEIPDVTDIKTDTGTQGYKKDDYFPAVGDDGKIMNIDQYCEHWGLPREDVHSYKLVTHTGTPYYNIAFKEHLETSMTVEDFESIVDNLFKKHSSTDDSDPLVGFEPKFGADRLVVTDIHVGMDPNPNGQSLYGGSWTEADIIKRVDEMAQYVIDNAQSDMLYLDDLGDLQDGWESYTARHDHRLQQNMDSERAFDVATSVKVRLVKILKPHYKVIVMNNVCNDNHGGAFAYVTNQYIKGVLELMFDDVFVNNIRKFMGHYRLLNRWKVISHGKDEEFMKAGMPVVPKPEHIDKIEAYCKANGIMDGSPIDFCKGDSHQMLFDFCSSDEINYHNYPAFSPSSGYVQTNFKKGRSGFVFENYTLDGHVNIHPYFFK